MTTIRYCRWALAEEIPAERKILDEFEAANAGIRVVMEYTSWSEYWNKLQAQFSAGTAPDVITMGGEHARDYAARGQLEDLTPQLAADASIKLENYFGPCVEVYQFDNGLWALPRDCNTVGIYYNKSLFKKVGVDLPKPDWNWDDFLAKAKALTRDEDHDGRMESYGFLAGIESIETQWGYWIWQNDGEILDANHRKSRLAEPAALEAMRFYSGLVMKEKVSPDRAQSSTFGSNMFLTGQLGMSAEGSWMVRAFSQAEGFEWDVVPLPRGKKSAAPVNGLGTSLYAKSKSKDAAWKLMAFVASERYQRWLAKSGSSIPALKSVAQSPDYLDGHPPGKKFLLEQMMNGRALPFTRSFAEWELAMRGQLELVWLGRKEIDRAMKDGADEVDAIIARESQAK